MASMCQSVLSVMSNELANLGDIQARDAIQIPGVVIDGDEPFSRPLTVDNRAKVNARIKKLQAKIEATASVLGISLKAPEGP